MSALMVRSRALVVCEPGQIREEAALSSRDQAPRVSLAGVSGRRERLETGFRGGCTVHIQLLGEREGPLRVAADASPESTQGDPSNAKHNGVLLLK